MHCYYQDQHRRVGGTFFFETPIEAVGVCKQCGVAVCAEHAHKEPYPGAPLLCYECASVQTVTEQHKESAGVPE